MMNQGAEEMKHVDGRITFQDVSFAYDEKEAPVLKHINLDVKPGETDYTCRYEWRREILDRQFDFPFL